MHQSVGLGLVAVLATAWLVMVAEPAERAISPLPGWEEAAPPDALPPVTHFPVKVDWHPPDVLCANGDCQLTLGTTNGYIVSWNGTNLDAPLCDNRVCLLERSVPFLHPWARLWSVDVTLTTLTGRSFANGLMPVILLKADNNEPKCDNTLKGLACTDPYRELGRSQGPFPLHLVLHNIALLAGETGIVVSLQAVTPPDATGPYGSPSLWHLQGEVEAVSAA